MPNRVEITETGKNIVEVSTTPTTLSITETTHTVEVAALTRAVGNATIASNIDITNTIGDAIAGGTYAAGTTLEEVVRDLIAPFLEPVISSISWSATGQHQADGEKLLVECGQAVTVTAVTLTFQNPENLKNESAVSATNFSAVPNQLVALLENITPGSLANPLTISATYSVPVQTSPFASTVTATAVYLGNNGTGSNVTISRSTKIAARHRVYVISSSQTSVPQLNAGTPIGNLLATTTAQAGGSTLLSTLAVDPGESSQSINAQCDAGSANTSNFTWILIPGSGTLGEVAAEVNGRGVADYTDSFIEFTNSGNGFANSVGTATPVYTAYRSIQPGAFDSDVTLNIEILH